MLKLSGIWAEKGVCAITWEGCEFFSEFGNLAGGSVNFLKWVRKNLTNNEFSPLLKGEQCLSCKKKNHIIINTK